MELAEEFEEYEPEVRSSFILIAVHLKYEKQIRNLQLQEARLFRRREKEIAELRQLQQERKSREVTQPVTQQARQTVPSIPGVGDGFKFSTVPVDNVGDFVNAHPAPIGYSKAA